MFWAAEQISLMPHNKHTQCGFSACCPLKTGSSSAAEGNFLLDSSWRLGPENFDLITTFLYSLIKSLHQVGGGRFKFALTQYSSSPEPSSTSTPTQRRRTSRPRRTSAAAPGPAWAWTSWSERTWRLRRGGPGGAGADRRALAERRGRGGPGAARGGVSGWRSRRGGLGALGALGAHMFNVDAFLKLWDIIQDLVVSVCGAVSRVGGPPLAEGQVTNGPTSTTTLTCPHVQEEAAAEIRTLLLTPPSF